MDTQGKVSDEQIFKDALLMGLKDRLSSNWDDPSWEGKPAEQARGIVDWVYELWCDWGEQCKRSENNPIGPCTCERCEYMRFKEKVCKSDRLNR